MHKRLLHSARKDCLSTRVLKAVKFEPGASLSSFPRALLVTAVYALSVASTSSRAGPLGSLLGNVVPSTTSTSAEIEVGFSPEGGAERLVVKAIRSARHSIRLAAYSFTSPTVVHELIAAKGRGVDVSVVVDEKNNLLEDRSGRARAVLNLLVNAGIPTRTISVYPIHHDKYIVVDGETVETGSFNYSTAAATRNSENAIVVWRDPDLAKTYVAHWQNRWEQGVPYQSSY